MDEDNKSADAPLQSEQKQENNSDPSDNLTPEHPRFKEVIADNHKKQEQIDGLQTQLNELTQKISERQEQTGEEELTPDEDRALERIQRGLRSKYNVLTQEDLRVERRSQNYKELSQKYDGSGDLPKFVPSDVETHAKANGFGDNLEAAYRDMHFQAFVQHEAKKAKEGVTPPSSERPTAGSRESANPNEFTPESIAAMSDEEYEKNRDKILSAIRSSTR